MRSPLRIASTRRRWRLFMPWMEKPCSRVLRKLSGELTTIQYWAARPPADLRLRLLRPDLARRGFSSEVGSSLSAIARLSYVHFGAVRRTEVLRLGKQGAEIADLRDVAHLVPGHHAADVEQRHVGAMGIGDHAFPLGVAPAVEQV